MIWPITGNKPLYMVAVKAWDALRKTCTRPTHLLDLTTGECAAIRRAISNYARALLKIETGVMVAAQAKAFAQLRR